MNALNFMTLIPLIACTFYIVLLIILMGSRKNKIARSYIYYITAMIIWSFCSFIMKTNWAPGALFWNRILVVALILMPVLFYNFTLVLTKIRKQRLLLFWGYFTACIFIFTDFKGLITEYAYMDLPNHEFLYELGPAAPVMAIWSLLYLIFAFVNIAQKVKTKEIPLERVRLILIGLVLVIIGGLLNLVPSIGKYPLDIIFNTLNAVFIVYSIYRHKFLEIKLIVKKGINYSLYTIFLTGCYIVSILVIQLMLIRFFNINNFVMIVFIAFLLAIIFQPLKNIIDHGLNRILNKNNFKSQMALKQFGEIINNVLDLNEIIETMNDVIKKNLQTKQISIALKQTNNDFIVYDKSNEMLHLKYDEDHPIVKWFLQGKSVLTVSDILTQSYFFSLWSKEKKQLSDLNMELIVPVKFRDKVTGLVILSEKHNGGTYSVDEISLVNAVVNHAAAVIENARMYEEAKEQAITDGLTKLYNHRYFHEKLSEISTENLYNKFSVAMIDVDLFKFYNDLYGHSAGDRALINLAKIIKESAPSNAIISRYGGEEFSIIFPEIEGEASLQAIEKIRRDVETSFNTNVKYGEYITVSAGVANYPKDNTEVEKVLDFADQAMYTAKQTGRNKAILYSYIDEENKQMDYQVDIKGMQERIKSAYLSSIYALAATIDAKDKYTYGHSENVANLAVLLAKEAGFPPDRLEIIKNAGLLHDIGKIGIPENILTKPNKLTKEEYEMMKKHVDISITIIKHIPNLVDVIPAIMSHHEKYNGEGYPLGKKGENIPIEGRCLCIVDAFDAMISDRPYRKAASLEYSIEELKKNKGIQFDPKLTDIFVGMIESGKLDSIIKSMKTVRNSKIS